MSTLTSTTPTYTIDQTGTGSFTIYNNTEFRFVRAANGLVRYFSSRSSARKAITRLNRPVGDRHR